MTTALIYDPIFLEHITPPHHPDRPGRLAEAMNVLDALDWLDGKRDGLIQLAPRAATVDEIATVHDREYIQAVEDASLEAARDESKGSTPGTYFATDTYVSAKSYEVARMAAGAPLVAIDAVMKGEVNNAYCLVRPPGHHAVPESGMGFCIFNNVAVAARYAIDHYGLERVLIIDYDVHHGNGTQEMFYDDPHVLYFSIHQAPFYPGTGESMEFGEGAGMGTTVNIPLPAQTGFETYEPIFRQVLAPLADRFNPQLILVSAGFDAHWKDTEPGIGLLPPGMQLSTAGFARLNQIILELASWFCEGRLVMVQEGGYHLEVMRACVATTINNLLGDDAAVDDLGPGMDRNFHINNDVLISELRRLHNLTGYRMRNKPKPDIERLRREVKGPGAEKQES
ncbi:MAG TPA: histone deacetylase [Ktedonobacteraceae bacterium]|nr:histone deacetylase [Ktedonobacteraceae bacterium]